MTLTGRVALVTGASRGIGRAIALQLARAGAHVSVNFRQNKAQADEVAREIQALDRKALVVEADVSDSASAERLVNATVDHFGHRKRCDCSVTVFRV